MIQTILGIALVLLVVQVFGFCWGRMVGALRVWHGSRGGKS